MRIIMIGAVVLAFAAPLSSARAAGADSEACFKATLETAGDKAIEVCGQLIDAGQIEGQELATALNNRGLGYLKNDELDLAEKDFDAALKINPRYVFAWDNLGDVWRARGLFDRAVEQYNKAIEVDPEFVSAILNRGQAYEQMGDKERARKEYQTVLDMPGKDRPIDKWAKGEARKHLDKLGE